MSGRKFRFLALTLIFAAAVFIPALLTGSASAECSVVNCLTTVQLFNGPNDYKWQDTWNPRFDADWLTHYGIINVRDCDVRCNRCDVRAYDRNTARDCDRSTVRDCDSCQRCPVMSEFRCDQFRCAWTRDYGCTSCGIRPPAPAHRD